MLRETYSCFGRHSCFGKYESFGGYMEYRILGNTGRRVSRIGFGGAVAGLKNYLQPYDPPVLTT
jgi:hypothetical protein